MTTTGPTWQKVSSNTSGFSLTKEIYTLASWAAPRGALERIGDGLDRRP